VSSDPAVPLDLASPLPASRISGQLQFEPVSFSQARGVRWRRNEFRATQAQGAFAGSFRWQSEAMSEFKFGLEEIRSQPIDRGGAQLTGTDCFGTWSCDRSAWPKHGLIITQYFRITNARVHHRHVGTLMTQHTHDGVELCATFCELGSHRMPKPVS
jgi:hypothetical protein